MPFAFTKQQALIFITIIIFSIVAGANAAHIHQTIPWRLNGDQMQFGNTVYKIINPELYSTDFVFATDRYVSFYTPTFIQISVALTRLTGDYTVALLLTQLPLALIYSLCAYLLYSSFTNSRVLGLLFTLLSYIGISALKGEWHLFDIYYMLARTYALPALTLTFYWFFRLTKHEKWNTSLRDWFILGIFIGLTTNFHPTTGMALAISLGTFALVHLLKSYRLGWGALILLVLGTVLASMPTIWHIVTQSSAGDLDKFAQLSSEDFRLFAEAIEWRIETYPFDVDFGRAWTLQSEEIQFLIRLPWITLSAVSWFLLRENSRSKAALVFMGVQFIYIWLTVNNIDVFIMVMIIAYCLYHWWAKSDRVVLLLLEVCAVIIMVGIFLPLVARPIWLHFELWSLSVPKVELPRGLKQIHIPITLLLACMANDLWRKWMTLESHSIFLRFTMIVSFIGGGGVFLFSVVSNVIDTALKTMTSNPTYIKIWKWVTLLISAIIILLVFQSLLGDFNRFFKKGQYTTAAYHGGILVATVLSLFVWLILRKRFNNDENGQITVLCGVLILVGLLQVGNLLTANKTPNYNPTYDVALWAKAETDIDALFAIYGDDFKITPSIFRLFSNRSILFSEKDLNTIGYSHPEDLVMQVERYTKFIKLSPENIISESRAEGTNYLVISTGKYNAEDFDLPIVYENPTMKVFSLD